MGVKFPLYLRQNNPSSLYFTYLPIVRSFGGDFLNRKTMLATGTLDSKETIAAYSYITWLIQQGYVNAYCDYEDAYYGKKESALALIGHWKYKDHVDNLGDDAIILPLPNMGGGVFTGSGSTIWAMTTTAENTGIADKAWKVMEKAVSPENISMVIMVNGALPSRKSVMDSNANYRQGGRLYLYREQLEAGISYLRPLTAAHATVYNAVKTATANIFAGANAADELREAAATVDPIIKENGWNR
jgi:multiple sugar transport system substrate-binding protein